MIQLFIITIDQRIERLYSYRPTHIRSVHFNKGTKTIQREIKLSSINDAGKVTVWKNELQPLFHTIPICGLLVLPYPVFHIKNNFFVLLEIIFYGETE